MPQEKRLKDAKAAAKEGDIRVFQTHNGGVMIPGVSLRYAPGYEPLAFARAFDLSGRAAV